MSNPRKIRAKRNLKKLENKRFRVIVTRDLTESAIVEVTASNRFLAADTALAWANDPRATTDTMANGTVKIAQKWEMDDNSPKKAYLGDPDLVDVGCLSPTKNRLIKGGSVEEIS